MTVEEAVGLVLEAATMAEYAETFVLDMGEPVAIVDLVHKYAAAVHLPEVTHPVHRAAPGREAQREGLLRLRGPAADRPPEDVGHPRQRRCRPTCAAMLDELYAAAAINDADGTLALLRALLPDYQPVNQPAHRPAVAASAPRTRTGSRHVVHQSAR